MKSENGEDERRKSHRKASDKFSQRQKIGATKAVRSGRLSRDVFQSKAKTRASSQTKNGIKREVMKQFSNNNSSSRYVVFKKTAPLQNKESCGITKIFIHKRGPKHIVSAARHTTTARKL